MTFLELLAGSPMLFIILAVVLGLGGCAYYYPVPYYPQPAAASTANDEIRSEPLPPPPNCREFTQTITVGGQAVQATGTACRQPDGSWRIM